jgi:hypothetical protein
VIVNEGFESVIKEICIYERIQSNILTVDSSFLDI